MTSHDRPRPPYRRYRLYRDPFGIPHVRATSLSGLAFGQGEVTALDRTWQLEWLRRRATGTTAAAIGSAGLDWDVLARRTRIVDVARRAHDGLDDETAAFVADYVAGVNAGLADPSCAEVPELAALGVVPHAWEAWTPLAVFVAQHLLFANLGGKLWAQRVRDALGADADLLDPEGAETPVGGSNAWGVGPGRTASGLPLVGGDPHRVIESPGVYQQVRLSCQDPDRPQDCFDVAGFAFPGVPGTPHFAHAGSVAWAITNAMADYQDVYAVALTEGHGGTVRDRRTEVVEVRDAEPVTVEVLRTAHGDVIEGDLASGRGLALRSSVAELGDCGFGALLPLLRARSAADVDRALEAWVEPVNNVVVADVGGDLRYRLAGRVPLRAGSNRHGVAEPDEPGTGWTGWLDPLPREVPGPDGEVVTANERRGPESEAVGAVFAPPYRADRIRALLAGRDDLTPADFVAVHDDDLLDERARLGWGSPADTGAGPWDGRMTAGSADAAAYAAWRSALVRRLVAEPALAALRAEAHPDTGLSRVLASFLDLTTRVARALPALLGRDRPLGIDVLAHAAAARAEVVAARAAGTLPTTWGETHVLTPVHALATARRDVADLAAVPAVPVSGDTDCVRCTASYPATTDAVSRGSVARYVWDLAERSAGGWVVPTGAAADPRSAHHHDQLDAWAAGRLVPIVDDWAELSEQPPRPGSAS